MPVRVKMSRQRPWRADHPDAVIVARPSKYGNPWRVVRTDCSLGGMCWGIEQWDLGIVQQHAETREEATRWAVAAFERDVRAHAYGYGPAEIRADLAGKDVACWCALDASCHGDPLLRIAAEKPRGETQA